MLTLNDGRKSLFQWDTGRKATVDIDCDAVHFANLNYGDSLVVLVKDGEVEIPNQLLTTGENVICWAFVVDDDGGYTKQSKILEVTKRAKPADYVYTETEVLTIQAVVDEAFRKALESGELIGDNLQIGKNVKIVGGEKETETGRLEVDRDFETYAASNRKFATYDYNCFFAKDRLANGKPLAVRTLVWTEPQLDAYSNQNTSTDLVLEDYKANPDKYYYDAEDDCYYRDIFVHYPLKDGQIAIIEKGGILRAYNFVGDNVKTGATNTAWVIFENDTKDNPNRMFNDAWNLTRLFTLNAPNADTTVKNLHSQTVNTPLVIFENDGGTEETYNRLFSEFWKLKKVTSIEAPKAEATFKKVTAGETKTGWVIFEGDNSSYPNRMHNDSWTLLQVVEINAARAETWLKILHTQAVYSPWLVFDNDGGTEATYNRLYNDWWKLKKLKTIDAPMADANFKSVKVNGEAVATAKDIGDIATALATISTELGGI